MYSPDQPYVFFLFLLIYYIHWGVDSVSLVATQAITTQYRDSIRLLQLLLLHWILTYFLCCQTYGVSAVANNVNLAESKMTIIYTIIKLLVPSFKFNPLSSRNWKELYMTEINLLGTSVCIAASGGKQQPWFSIHPSIARCFVVGMSLLTRLNGII